MPNSFDWVWSGATYDPTAKWKRDGNNTVRPEKQAVKQTEVGDDSSTQDVAALEWALLLNILRIVTNNATYY